MSASSPEHVVPFSIRWIPNPHPTTAAPHISITQLEEAVAAQHATNEEAMEKETMEKEPHLTQMRLALTDISSDPAELCALPQMITLTAQGIAEAAKGSQNQRTEELQREMRSLRPSTASDKVHLQAALLTVCKKKRPKFRHVSVTQVANPKIPNVSLPSSR